jgi:hypothetical protein
MQNAYAMKGKRMHISISLEIPQVTSSYSCMEIITARIKITIKYTSGQHCILSCVLVTFKCGFGSVS